LVLSTLAIPKAWVYYGFISGQNSFQFGPCPNLIKTNNRAILEFLLAAPLLIKI